MPAPHRPTTEAAPDLPHELAASPRVRGSRIGWTRPGLAVAILALGALPSPALASRVPMSLPALCGRASLVVVGEITGGEARWTADDRGIETRWDVHVSRVVRGEPREDLVVRASGGTVGGITQTISEAPRLRSDGRYLLLLGPGADAWELVGGADGAVPLPWDDPQAEARALANLGACRE